MGVQQETCTPAAHSPPPANNEHTLTYRWLVQFNPTATNARIPLKFDDTTVSAVADSGSTRSLVSTALLLKLRGPKALEHLVRKKIRPIDDINGRPVRVLGCTSVSITLGPKKVQAEFHVFESQQELVVLGYIFFHRHKVLLHPGIGLLEQVECPRSAGEVQGDNLRTVPCPSLLPTFEQGYATLPRQAVVTADQQVVLLVRAVREQLVPARAQLAMHVRVDLAHLHEADRAHIRHLPLVFHSEELERKVPLHKISVYHQFTYLDGNYRAVIKFANHTPDCLTINKDQIIAHAQAMEQVEDQQVLKSGDDVALYVRSLTPPHLAWDAGLLASDHHRVGSRGHTGIQAFPNGPPVPLLPASGGEKEQGGGPGPHPLPPEPPPTDFGIRSDRTLPNEMAADPAVKDTKEQAKNFVINGGDVKEEAQFIRDLFTAHPTGWARSSYDVGRHGAPVSFKIKEGSKQYFAKAHPIPHSMRKDALLLLDSLLAAGIVQEAADAPKILSGFFFVRKSYPELPEHLAQYPGQKDYTHAPPLRAVVNMQYLNSVIDLPVTYPVQDIRSIFRDLHKARICGVADLSSAFYNIPVCDEVKPYLCFQVENVVYTFTALPMGCSVSGALFLQRVMAIKCRYNLHHLSLYMDNLVVHAEDTEQYKQAVSATVAAFTKEHFKFQLKKCFWWLRDSVQLYGFVLNLRDHTLSPDPDKVSSILRLPRPASRRTLKGFLGSVGFWNGHIPQLQLLLGPLHKLASPLLPYKWSPACEAAYAEVCRNIAHMTNLYLPSPLRPIWLFADGNFRNKHGCSWLFAQHDEKGMLRPITHGSKALTESQQGGFSQPEVEAYTVMSALLKEPALTRYSTIVVCSDCRSLQFMVKHAASYGKLQRWVLFLQSLDLVWHWEPSSHPAIRWSDILGRLPLDSTKKALTRKPRHDGMDLNTYVDMSGLPAMGMDQAHTLISSIQAYLDTPAGLRLVQAHHAATGGGNTQLRVHPSAPQRPLEPLPISGGEAALAAVPKPRGQLRQLQEQQRHQAIYGRHEWLPAAPPTLGSSELYAFSSRPAGNHNPMAPKQPNRTDRLQVPRAPSSVFHPTFSESDLKGKRLPPPRMVATFLNAVTRQLPKVTLQAVSYAQTQDDQLRVRIEALKKGKNVEGYFLAKGVLLKVNNLPAPRIRLALPPQVARSYLQFLHKHFRFHHLEEVKLLHLYTMYFYTPGAANMAEKTIKNCSFCQLNNRAGYKAQQGCNRLVITRPRQLIYSDIAQFLSGTRTVQKSFVLFTDGFSGFTRIMLAPANPSAEDLTVCFMDFLGLNGPIFACSTDNGSCYQSVLTQTLSLLGIFHYRIAAYNAKADFSELKHQQAFKILRELYQNDKLTDPALQAAIYLAQYVLNSTPYRSLGWFSPYQLHYGSEPTGDLVRPARFVSPGSRRYPHFVKEVAEIQATMFAVANDVRRLADQAAARDRAAKEQAGEEAAQGRQVMEDTKGGRQTNRRPPLDKPMFNVGEIVVVKRRPDATKRHHKLLSRYHSVLHQLLKLSGNPRNRNWLALPLKDDHAVQMGVMRAAPVPRNRLVLLKEDRIKRVSNIHSFSPAPLAMKLTALLRVVVMARDPPPTDFKYSPTSCPVIPCLDESMQKLIKKAIKTPKMTFQADSEVGKVVHDSIYGAIREFDVKGSSTHTAERAMGPRHFIPIWPAGQRSLTDLTADSLSYGRNGALKVAFEKCARKRVGRAPHLPDHPPPASLHSSCSSAGQSRPLPPPPRHQPEVPRRGGAEGEGPHGGGRPQAAGRVHGGGGRPPAPRQPQPEQQLYGRGHRRRGVMAPVRAPSPEAPLAARESPHNSSAGTDGSSLIIITEHVANDEDVGRVDGLEAETLGSRSSRSPQHSVSAGHVSWDDEEMLNQSLQMENWAYNGAQRPLPPPHIALLHAPLEGEEGEEVVDLRPQPPLPGALMGQQDLRQMRLEAYARYPEPAPAQVEIRQRAPAPAPVLAPARQVTPSVGQAAQQAGPVSIRPGSQANRSAGRPAGPPSNTASIVRPPIPLSATGTRTSRRIRGLSPTSTNRPPRSDKE